MKKMFRAECNHGSKYFTDIAEAYGYFYKCLADRKSVELWIVVTKIRNGKVIAFQELIDSAYFI
jgi:hypothetical protein